MVNICVFKKIECKSADENGNCTTPMVTKDGLFIVGERWCDSEGVLLGKGKTVEQILAEKEISPACIAEIVRKTLKFSSQS